MDAEVRKHYEEWKNYKLPEDLTEDLMAAEGNEEEINDRFYRMLEFGTAGLRGILGAGTNRMNIYTVGRASAGFARYLIGRNPGASVAIAYDSRINSDVFARETAAIMAEKGVHVYIWPELMPTPSLSFAVRYYKCDGGVVVTASHNPSQYNGYKAYDETGCQLGEEAAAEVFGLILEEPELPDMGNKRYTFEQGLADGRITMIPDKVRDAFIEAASAWSMCPDNVDKSVRIAYTPLYGTGLRCVTECLRRNGFTNIVLVDEQAKPDGHFPTCPYPNPEIREAMEVGLKVAADKDADLLIATDPDADRIGIAVRNRDGSDYELITGNQTGMLILDYLIRIRKETGRMPKDPVAVKSIVSTDMIYSIAEAAGVEVVDVLTGFKNIAPVVTELDRKGEAGRYIFGFEESYGYMMGTHVRDKDSVSAALVIAEMFAYHRAHGLSLLDVLDEIYRRFGYYYNNTRSYSFPGESGFMKMQSIMEWFRNNPPEKFAGIPVVEIQDYSEGYKGLPGSNVLKYILKGHSMVVLRPSGTEPKLKLYIGVNAKNEAEAVNIEEKIAAEADIGNR